MTITSKNHQEVIHYTEINRTAYMNRGKLHQFTIIVINKVVEKYSIETIDG